MAAPFMRTAGVWTSQRCRRAGLSIPRAWATHFVAGFLGSPRMNFVPGTLAKDLRFAFDDGTSLDLPSDRWPREALGSDRRYLLGVRPEHISTPKGPETKDHPRLTLGVDLVQPTGTRTYVTCRLGGQPVIAELQSQDIDSDDETIDLAIDLSRANLIDAESGKVLLSQANEGVLGHG